MSAAPSSTPGTSRPPAADLPRLALGLGCDRGTPVATLRQAVSEALAQLGRDWSDIAAVASITLKADEPGLLALAAEQSWQIHFHAPAELAAVPVPHPSETVRKYTGTPSVSEAAALLAAGGGTHPAPPAALVIEKHKLRGADGRNATVSMALFPFPADLS
ncbi:cobalamin biosynthesis protein [Brachymonas sp. M4Q-1]|uniref:cobalamin biosynthesis protein n=1 Tax=Brachymonas sp. M4Q-1 TaxID=3416906 RepID=UPI003CF6D428